MKKKREKTGKPITAKNFKISFNCDQNYINSNLQTWNYFSKDEIKSITTTGNVSVIEISCKARKNLYISNKKLILGNIMPVNIETKGRKEQEVKEYAWIKDVPHGSPIQAFGGVALKSDFKQKQSSKFLIDFLKQPTKENADAFITLIKKEMEALNLQLASESALTCMLFKHILFLKDLPNFKIISVDSKMRENILSIDNDFRFDLAFDVLDLGILIENKYKSESNNEQIDAHSCLYYRAYPQRLINYLQRLKIKVPKTLICIGIGFSKESTISIGMKYSVVEVEKMHLNGYKSKEFLDEMKTNKRRFKNLGYLNDI
jgi:hypothetical protein